MSIPEDKGTGLRWPELAEDKETGLSSVPASYPSWHSLTENPKGVFFPLPTLGLKSLGLWLGEMGGGAEHTGETLIHPLQAALGHTAPPHHSWLLGHPTGAEGFTPSL